jgi:hypothetical protein
MIKVKRHVYGQITFRWLTDQYGNDWEDWRAYAESWLQSQSLALDLRRQAIIWFLRYYLISNELSPDPRELFNSDADLPNLIDTIEFRVKSNTRFSYHNYIVAFIDWIIAKDYSESNDYGQSVPLLINPFLKEKWRMSSTETVYNPLPYTYIKELRSILCSKKKGNFCDWDWAQKQTGKKSVTKNSGHLGDWFEVDFSLIDKTNLDCVWRERVMLPGQHKTINGKSTKLKKELSVFEMWSPVRAMLLYIKLHLPLRTHQVHMLDSGEADTWRYESNQWQINTKHNFAIINEKAPWQRGVFRRIRSIDNVGLYTGMYINTNKTADQNKDVTEMGYVIPWQYEEVLFWLEKLRNWQEKYNPIEKPTLWSSLDVKHLGSTKAEQVLKLMGRSCFLFRNACAKIKADRTKPMIKGAPVRLWYRLLKTLENRVFERGQTHKDGTRLHFVKEYDSDKDETRKTATNFPLHSLRVSLITCYAMEGQVPLPVISKLLAGHSRIIMTLHYCKFTPSVMNEKMQIAETLINAKEKESLKHFLADAELNKIHNNTVFKDVGSISTILVNRNPLGWEQRYIGLCLAGGNTVTSDEKSTLSGCWNGGETIKEAKASKNRIYGPVTHGPENCVRCRWFITDVLYLHALLSHCNNLSYRAHLAANLAVEIEHEVESLQDSRCSSMEANKPFTKIAELQEAERRYDKQIVEADEYTKDFLSCFTLIHRIINIETNRDNGDDFQKLVAVGKQSDISQPISLLETQSELFQLSGICEDAEIYSDLSDELRKTPALEKRSRALNMALMREGYQPIFMVMDEKMQLILGNAMIRAMAKQVCPEDWRNEGISRVSGIIEAERSLQEYGLIDIGVNALEKQWEQPVLSLNELLKKTESELLYDQSKSPKITI